MLGMDGFVDSYGTIGVVGATVAMAAGGFAKGVVGFALPLIGLSVAGAFVPFPVAVALLILPMMVSNLVQTLRQGIGPAIETLRIFWRLNLILVVTIALSAQLLVVLPERFLFGLLGMVVSAFGASQLAGWRPRFPTERGHLVEAAVAVVAGFFGGLSGIWGPPVVMYLVARDLPKVDLVRAQSLSFLLGSTVLMLAHLRSGILDAVTLPTSAWLVLPTMAGMALGYRVHDRLDQRRFRTLTLVVLVVSGLNLLRRAVF